MTNFIKNLMFVVFVGSIIGAIWYEPFRSEFGWTAFALFVVGIITADA